MNTLTRSGARDMLERLSRTAESLLPLAIVVMLVPVAVGLGGLGVWTGWAASTHSAQGAFALQIVRWVLLAVFVTTLLSPAILSAGQQTAGLIRLLLLPIPARVLYLAHAAGALADPWVFLAIPLLAGLCAGAAFAGAIGAGALILLGGGAILLTLLGLAALAGAVLQLLVRNRRRAEFVVLVGMLFIVMISIAPSLILTDEADDDSATGRRSHRTVALPQWMQVAAATTPSELYVAGVRDAANQRHARASRAIVAIVAWGAALHALTWPVYRRLLNTPATTGTRRRTPGARARSWSVPVVNPVVSAVAIAFVRLAVRTPRGRSIVLMPVVMLAGFAAMFLVRGASLPFGPVQIGGGYSLGLFGMVIGLLAIGPLVFNQFAVDRAGLTLEFLAPISTRELLYGKAIGGALIAALPCALSVAAGIMTGAHTVSLWLAILLGACASYLITAPIAAVLSLLFPRAVDLSSIGQGSNAHQAAGLLGFLSFAVSCIPPVAVTLVGFRALHSVVSVLAMLAAWVAVALVLSIAGFRIAERLLDERRENLAMVAQGR